MTGPVGSIMRGRGTPAPPGRGQWSAEGRRPTGSWTVVLPAVLWFVVLLAADRVAAQRPLGLRLPTENEALFSGGGPDFYMYVDRSFEGARSSPWQGGKYGYVRDPKRTKGGLVFTKFHEGIDIKPVRRDANGEPLDAVRAIADGRVVYTNESAGKSSYGRYAVVVHDWGDGPFYSLYAHMMSISVSAGTPVKAGTELGRLGYTGTGIDRRRAHLHLELNLLLSDRFEEWHRRTYPDPNHHGIYNGLNMAGIDIAGLFVEHRGNPRVTMREFISRMEPYYRVAVPKSSGFDLLGRYPWLAKGNVSGAPALEITFSSSGVPLAVAPCPRSIAAPEVTWVKPAPHYHSWNTRGRLTGSGSKAALSDPGLSYVRLVSGAF